MAELDRQTIEELGVPGRVLMELAGRAVADEVIARIQAPASVVILAGPGNNGGDGFVCARALAARGFRVELAVFASRGRLRGDARAVFQTLEREESVRIQFVDDARELWELSTRAERAAVLVDALLGTGLREDVRGLIGDAIVLANRCPAPVIAVDIPSGIDADTGRILGRAVQAEATVTFAFAKRGHYLFPGREMSGALRIVDIGVPEMLATRFGVVGRALDADDGPGLIPVRSGDSHKGSYGHVVVVAGREDMPGAGVLACSGALHGGAGLVSWSTTSGTWSTARGLGPEIMLRLDAAASIEDRVATVVRGADTLVVGPGLGVESDRAELLAALFVKARCPICIDADGLNLLSRNPEWWDLIQVPTVVTPHPKELARLLGGDVASVQRDRFASASQLAVRRRTVVVLKGAGTVVAEPDGSVTVIDAGNPGMATAGTGDVLAGLVGGLLAQGLEPVQAAQAGALLHGCAGDRASRSRGQAALRATDVLTGIGDVLAGWNR